jgi:glycosyltransferase involved in cell wall biosynthesis
MARRDSPRLVSVVVPVLDEARWFPVQLEALAAQTYEHPWELVIADNGSSDGSLAIAEEWLPRFPQARLVHAPERRMASHARNVGAADARGDLLLFTDADDLAEPDWIEQMVAAARSGDVIAGEIGRHRLNHPRVAAWHPVPPRQRALEGFGFLAYASGSNTGVWADLFHALGGFDTRRPAGEDIELSWRAQLAGYELVLAPGAVVNERYRGNLRQLGRQHFFYGTAGPHLYEAFRDHGMPRPRPRESARTYAWLLATAPSLLWSHTMRGRWTVEAALKAGAIVGSARRRVLFV